MSKRYVVYLTGHVNVYAPNKEAAAEAVTKNLETLHPMFNLEIMTTKLQYDLEDVKKEGTD